MQVPVAVLAALILLLRIDSAGAQSYPVRPLRLVVGNAPGGPTDTVARIVAQKLSESVGVSVIVDNRSGATGVVAANLVAKAPPDGYTLLLCSSSVMVTTPLQNPKLPYDTQRDFEPITVVVSLPYLLLVNPASGISSVKELIALGKAKPGELNAGAAGHGSTSYLGAAMMALMAGIEITHVTYKGSALAAIDLMAGRLHFAFEAIAGGIQHVKNGKLRPLGVSARNRLSALPDLPTISEAGVPGYELTTWHGICTTGGAPPAIVAMLNREIVAGIKTPQTRERLTEIGAEVVGNSPEEFRMHLRTERVRWDRVFRQLGLKKS